MISLDSIIKKSFSKTEIDSYKKIRSFQQNIGRLLEDYINSKMSDNVYFVGRDRDRPEGVDYVVDGVFWSVKNAWNTDNHSMKKYREDRNIKHWFRLNKDGSTNWGTLFVKGVSEGEFIEFVTGEKQNSLEEFFL